jgi:hypothetical protein
LAISLVYPSGEEEGNFLVQMTSTCLDYKEGEGGSAPCGAISGPIVLFLY